MKKQINIKNKLQINALLFVEKLDFRIPPLEVPETPWIDRFQLLLQYGPKFVAITPIPVLIRNIATVACIPSKGGAIGN